MKVKGIIFQDFVNYKNPCMTIMMPKCDFKCDRECGRNVCQNSRLANEKDIDVSNDYIIEQYLKDSLTEAIVFQGLEPFDSFDALYSFIYKFTEKSNDDIVIYTGYNKEEILNQIDNLNKIIKGNKLIIKFGRFIPDQESHKDEVLGVMLASNNQYAEII